MMKTESLKYTPLLVVQVALIGLYIGFTDYGTKTPKVDGFEGTHVMIFIGFGFLMTFLKKYSYSALGLNWLLAAIAIQWALLCQQFFTMKDNTILISKNELIEADIMSATVLITFGALLGVASSLQLLVITLIEVTIGCLNLWLAEEKFKVTDPGGSMAIHTFGAYFGLGVSLAYRKKKVEDPNSQPTENLNGPVYVSDVTAMIGSIFLWIYWPAFNSGLTHTATETQRAVVNTYLSLAGATVATFVMSALVNRHHPGKFDMVHVQNSTLAGGVAVGAVCTMVIKPGVAMAIGTTSGIFSVLGYRYLTPAMIKWGWLDTCGVNNLHGMPGLFSGLLSILFAALATSDAYGSDLTVVFEAMGGDAPRTAGQQALYQLYALLTTIGLGFGGGVLTGFLTKSSILQPLEEKDRYNDALNWELP